MEFLKFQKLFKLSFSDNLNPHSRLNPEMYYWRLFKKKLNFYFLINSNLKKYLLF